jgi:peptidyl-tRNA hydrolase, PTH1 family
VSDSTEKQFVIVGLGNPGKKYEFTRHNAGWLVAKAFAHSQGWSFKEEKRFFAWIAKGRYDGTTVHVVLPATYMNESGRAVRPYLDFFKLGPDDLVVISDDVELPFGHLRLRPGGSSGGHNGLKSIEAQLGTQNYVRLRIGVGKDLQAPSLADYVLDTFKPEEFTKLNEFIERGAEVIKCLLKEDITHVMNKVNAK